MIYIKLKRNFQFSILISGIILLVKLKFVKSVGDEESWKRFEEESFCYTMPSCGPSNFIAWPGACQNGHRQSPINLGFPSTMKIAPNFGSSSLSQGFYRGWGERRSEFFIKNNGEGLEMFFPEEERGEDPPVLSGESLDLDGDYVFQQLHFHWGENDKVGSEHRIHGLSFPLELHMVHYSTRYSSFEEALSSNYSDSRAIAVISIFYQISSYESKELNGVLEGVPYVREYKRSRRSKDPESVKLIRREIHLKNFFPTSSLDFYRYEGSLTTPNCMERVIWTVFKTPKKISKWQMKQFRSIIGSQGPLVHNYRPLQSQNGREIILYKSPSFSISYLINCISLTLKVIFNLIKTIFSITSTIIIPLFPVEISKSFSYFLNPFNIWKKFG